ncbi:short-chain dehydrogenase/reductase family 9C member 7-like [Ambystoma mexicanum]|uniref:short-chain dehydrogenase/reductase family 9C member 7-like n=1 Tax=Ambystoma mexicanum TaxID=8296 RepID=UPI0037E77DB7
MWRWLGFPLLLLLLCWCLGPLWALLLLAVPALGWFALGGRGQEEPPPPLDPRGRAVFITGCDTGFGNLLARRLHRLGFSVYAACLFPEGQGARELQEAAAEAGGPERLSIVKLDVRRDSDVAEAAEFVKGHLPEKGLWALVNNAGLSACGNTDWHSINKYKQVVDVNLIGSIRTTLAFLPLIRKYKGRMVFMSSTNAFVTAKNGIYSMTKAALERFCDSLRLDMKSFGVKVSIIEPGNYSQATNIQMQKPPEVIWNELSEEVKAIYSKEYVQEVTELVNDNLRKGSSKGYEVIDAIVEALTSASPRARYMVASMKEKIIVFLFCICPTSWLDALLSSTFK